MLIGRLFPGRCQTQSDALRRAAELHAISSLAVGAEARKTSRRVMDMRITADAAERRHAHRDAQIAALNALLDRER